MQLTIECQSRPQDSKPKALRRTGKIPATLYGHNGSESMSLVIDTKLAENLVRAASINNTLIQVKIPDRSWEGRALLREIQSHPYKSALYHLSFFAIAAQDSLEVDVPLHFIGTAKGVKDNGGRLETELTSLHVKCAPDQIPDAIEVDVSALEIGDSLHIYELNLPTGVEPTEGRDQVVVTVFQPRSAEAGDEVESTSL